MFRSLHMKLTMIMLLLVTALMIVVGAFLMTSISNFYTNQFYNQMDEMFGEQNAAFVNSLRSEASQNDGLERLQALLEINAGALGIDSHTRNYYILNGEDGQVLAGSEDTEIKTLDLHDNVNVLSARNGQVGDTHSISADDMDVAVPISGSDKSYIIYIRDNCSDIHNLTSQLLMILLQALLVGLVFSVLLSFLLSKALIIPIERLTKRAEQVAAGHFEGNVEAEASDEIGILTNTFNDMAAVLQQTLEKIESERNKLDTLFLHMTDGVVAYNRNGEVIHCNPAASEMLMRPVEKCSYTQLFQQVYPFELVLAMRRPNFAEGQLNVSNRFLEIFMAPFSSGEDAGVLVVLHDVTAQRKTEELRKEFVANVSHELRTPLTNVRSYAETLRSSDALPRSTEESFLDVIISETDRMTHIVQDLLTLSRMDSGHFDMKMETFPFGQAIESVYRSIQLEAQRHKHTLYRDYNSAALPEITGDRQRLEQVMMNIVGNAVKYTPDGGEIHIAAGIQGRKVWMEVSDNGIGIPKADRGRIFERFYRVDKARSRESGGTGLGLSIAKEIVDLHHGSIGIVDRDGPGTTIRLVLPIRQVNS